MTVTPDSLTSLDYAIGYAEAAGGEPIHPDANLDYFRGWTAYFTATRGVTLDVRLNGSGGGATWRFVADPKPAEAVL